eukprot:2527302-Amphidinium_carterae.1
MGRRSPASRAPSLGSCRYNISLIACGQVPVASTILRKVAKSAMAMSGSILSSAMLQRSTPRALPSGQCRITERRSPVTQEDWEVALAGKVVCPGCQSLLQAASSACVA